MNEYQQRAWRLAAQFPPDMDAALVTSQVNLFYFTGFNCDNAWMFIGREKCVYVTDFRYTEAARAKIDWCEVVEYSEARLTLSGVCRQMKLDTVSIERQRMTVGSLGRLSAAIKPVKIIDDSRLDDMIAYLRDCKSESELAAIKRSQAVTELAFNHILDYAKPGMTEREIALELEFTMRRNGAQRNAFDLIVASGVNGSMPHAVPTDKKIEKGEIVTVDMGAVVDGYHSDMTRNFSIGKPSPEMMKIYETVKQAQAEAVDYLVKGGIGRKEADSIARDIIYGAGYEGKFGHSLGHGVGLEIHETPNLAPHATGDLTAGNVVTVEPGIYVEGLGGVRIEDMMFITESSAECLTTLSHELFII